MIGIRDWARSDSSRSGATAARAIVVATYSEKWLIYTVSFHWNLASLA